MRCSTMFTTDYHYRPANQAIRRRTMSTVALTAAQSTRPSAVSLQADLRAAPVATLRVIPDLVVRAHANPLRDRPVLLQLLGKRLLDAEALVTRHGAAKRRGGAHVNKLRSRPRSAGSLRGGRGHEARASCDWTATPTSPLAEQVWGEHMPRYGCWVNMIGRARPASTHTAPTQSSWGVKRSGESSTQQHQSRGILLPRARSTNAVYGTAGVSSQWDSTGSRAMKGLDMNGYGCPRVASALRICRGCYTRLLARGRKLT